ncbi:hypothetical protein GX420_05700, partial [bacterium]|nr:hypothetical protein [bacterium]
MTLNFIPSAFGKDSKGIDISGLQNLKGEIILTGNFTGKFVNGCTFNGTAQGTARVYDKSPIYCKPYDIKKEFTSP